jgi:hypothetical protein
VFEIPPKGWCDRTRPPLDRTILRESVSGGQQEQLVGEAPGPVLHRLQRAGDGVVHGLPVGPGVPAGRAVAATDVTAAEALPQMDPTGALTQTVLAPVEGAGGHVADLAEVVAARRGT